MSRMTVEESQALMTPEAYEKLKELVTVKPVIDTSKKAGNDILMAAFCIAVQDKVIKDESLDDKLIKLLNSSTNTLSQQKLKYLMDVVQQKQPNLICTISIMTADMSNTIYEIEYHKSDVIDFLSIFQWLLKYFNVTPSEIRNKMSTTLKPTIVNNISQLVSRVLQNNTNDLVVSIATITRIVNTYDHLIFAEFSER